ncbi:helix-turn-helix domain-containing protein [Ramlibacter sp. AN1015]|uniref:GlxA family transcriptional regulator n=1 Tax=Ramlibacter sp. AN1015 TaxID=3133428 RepID=UPI0030BCD9A8
MADPSVPVTVALLAAEESSAATIFGFYDALMSARRDWAMLHGGAAQDSPFRPVVVSEDGQPLTTGNGVRITPDACFAEVPAPQVAVVADLGIPPGADPGPRFDAAVRWLCGCHAAGGMLASACSGALLLARTGLLDGLQATTHWAYCEHLRRAYPRIGWQADRGLVVAGEGQRILMAGSGVSWHLLVLALIARFAGAEEAMRVARINLMDLNDATPQAYASLTHGSRAADPVIASCQQWVAMHYAHPSPVAQMVALSQMAERTFKRRFSAATGMAPLEYIHHVRLEEAKQMLECGEVAVESVAFDVGYSDTSFFSRLFRRKVGLTPAQYRQRFGRLSREVQGRVH